MKTSMDPELELTYQRAFAKLTQQVEERFSQLEAQLGALASQLPATESPGSSKASKPAMLTVEEDHWAWAFALSSISHFSWDDKCLRAYLLSSSGEKKVEFSLQGEVRENLSPLWAKLAANIASGMGPLTYPCDVGGERITAAIK
jgi:hypothetical protein